MWFYLIIGRNMVARDRVACVAGKKPHDVDKALVQLIRQFTSFRAIQEPNREPMSISLERMP